MVAKYRWKLASMIVLASASLCLAQPGRPAELPPAEGQTGPLSGLLTEPSMTYTSPRWLRRDSVMSANTGNADGPIGQELSLFTGPSLPIGGGILTGQLTAGWMLDLRANSVAFINDARSAAWIVHYGAGYIYDWQSSRAPLFDLFGVPVRVEHLHRFYLALGIGRDWFIYNSGLTGQSGSNLRVGVDTGGRWGGMRANLRTAFPVAADNFMRRYDVYGAGYWGAHLTYEVNMDGWTWFGGFRSEYSVTWSDILPGSNGTLQDLNFLLTTGIRY
jgi:hypothetical protein